MKNEIEAWRNALLTLPENIFYDLVYTYLGPIPSPHHKPDLINGLTAFLSNQRIKDAYLHSLSKTELEILLTIQWTGAMHKSVMPNPYVLHNLLDRLWIYESDNEIRLNPHLKTILPAANQKSTSYEHGKGFWTPGFVLGLMSLAPLFCEAIKKDGKIAKKHLEPLNLALSGLKDYSENFEVTYEVVEAIMRGFIQLGILKFEADQFHVVKARVDELLALDFEDIVYIFVSATIPHNLQKQSIFSHIPHFQTTNLIMSRARILRDFLLALPTKVSQNAIQKVMLGFQGDMQQFLYVAAQTSLIELGILSKTGESDFEILLPTNNLRNDKLRFNNSNIIIPEGISFDAIRVLWPVINIERFGRLSQATINPAGIKSLFVGGFDLAALKLIFVGYFEPQPPASFFTQLEWWADEARAVLVKPGVLLELYGHRGEDIKTLIDQKPGVLKISDHLFFVQSSAYGLLYELGDKNLLDLRELALPPNIDAEVSSVLPPLRALVKTSSYSGYPEIPSDFVESTVVIERLCKSLEALTNLNDVQKKDAKILIDKKLIVDERQLEFAPKPSDRGQAMGFDFGAKVRSISASIAAKNEIMKLSYLSESGVNHLLVRAMQVDGRGQEAIMLAKTYPDNKDCSIPIRKISSLYRSRESIHY